MSLNLLTTLGFGLLIAALLLGLPIACAKVLRWRLAQLEAASDWQGMVELLSSKLGLLRLQSWPLEKLDRSPVLDLVLEQCRALRELGRPAELSALLREEIDRSSPPQSLLARLHLCSHLVREADLNAAALELRVVQSELPDCRSERRRAELAEQAELLRLDLAARRGEWPEETADLPLGSRLLLHLARGQFLEGLALVAQVEADEEAPPLTGGPLLTATVLAAEADRASEVGERLQVLGPVEGLSADARPIVAAIQAWHAARMGNADRARQSAALAEGGSPASSHALAVSACWLARTALLLAQAKEALKHAERAVAIAVAPLSRHSALYWRGRCSEELERFEAARADYEALEELGVDAAWSRSGEERRRALSGKR